MKLADVKRLRNHLTKDVKLPNGNKRKLSEDSNPVHVSLPPSSPPLTVSPESSLALTISRESSPALTISPESSDSSPPLSPVEMFSSPLSSPRDDEDDDVLTSSPESSSPKSEESPIRRQKMRSPGLD